MHFQKPEKKENWAQIKYNSLRCQQNALGDSLVHKEEQEQLEKQAQEEAKTEKTKEKGGR